MLHPRRELNDGLYKPLAYVLARLSEEYFAAALGSLLGSLITFYGFKMQGTFFIFWLAFYITLCTGIGATWASTTCLYRLSRAYTAFESV